MKRALIVSLAVVLALSLSLVPLPAQTAKADPGTIQEAINAASPGDTIVIATGTYNENIVITTANLTLQGSGASETTIHASSSSKPTIKISYADNVTILGFTISGGSEGIYSDHSATRIANNIIRDNTFGVKNVSSSALVINNTIVKGKSGGAGIKNYSASSPKIINNIIAYNSTGIDESTSIPRPTETIAHNILLNDTSDYNNCGPGTNDWRVEPDFVDLDDDDYHLSPDSPCIDYGSNSYIPDWLTEDFEGDDRIWNEVVDCGADEYVEKNTETGSDVTVSFPDKGVDVTFTEVTKAGNTAVTTSGAGPDEIPSGFALAGDYYDINTTATYSGNVTICIEYNPASISGPEEELCLYHYEEDSWVDVTTSVDTEADKIYGEVESLSVFAMLDPNQPPEAEDDAYDVDEDETLDVDAPGVLANDTDTDEDPLKAYLDDDVSYGTLTLSDNGSFSYTPDADFNGTDSFTYVANDGTDDSEPATVTITVDPVNDDPVADDDTAITDEDTAVTIDVLANDYDVDIDTLEVDSVTQGANGSVTDNGDGTVTYIPDANFHGIDSFTYTLVDGNGGSDEATVTITIIAVNDLPAAGDDAYDVDEGETLDVDAPGVLDNDTDADEDSLKAYLDSDVSHGTLTLNDDGSFSYTPDGSFSGTDSFTYVANDGSDDSDPATVTITVNPVQAECNFAAFTVSHMIVHKAPEQSHQGNRWWRWFKWFWPKENDTFHIWGRLQLPDGYSPADLDESATLTVTIADESGSDTVSFQKRSLGRWGALWQYNDKAASDEELNITQMTIWWTTHRSSWATFYIKGELELPEDVAKGAEATVTLEMPLTDGAGCDRLTGEDTVKIQIFKQK